MAYKFYIAGMQLPIPPGSFEISYTNKNEQLTLADGGEITVINPPGLKTYTLGDVLLPAYKYPFADYPTNFEQQDGTVKNFIPPQQYIDVFQTLKTERLPFQLDIYREIPTGEQTYYTNETVTLEDFTVTESTDNGLDVIVSLKFKEYRQYGTQYVELSEDGVTYKTTRAAGKRINRIVPAQKGDTLVDVAKREFGAVSQDLLNYLYVINNDESNIADAMTEIENPELWADGDRTALTNAIALIDKSFMGGFAQHDEILPGRSWAEKNVLSLYYKKIITDRDFYMGQVAIDGLCVKQEEMLEFIDRATDGTLAAHKAEAAPEKYLNSLVDKGIIGEPEKWSEFGEKVTNTNTKALVTKAMLYVSSNGMNLYEGQAVKLTDDNFGSYEEWMRDRG